MKTNKHQQGGALTRSCAALATPQALLDPICRIWGDKTCWNRWGPVTGLTQKGHDRLLFFDVSGCADVDVRSARARRDLPQLWKPNGEANGKNPQRKRLLLCCAATNQHKFQSAGGELMDQKSGAGCSNSIPTWAKPAWDDPR